MSPAVSYKCVTDLFFNGRGICLQVNVSMRFVSFPQGLVLIRS